MIFLKKLFYNWISDFDETTPFYKVRLRITPNLEFKVLNTFYTYRPEIGFGCINLKAYTYAESKEYAEVNIKNSNNLLTYLYWLPIDFGSQSGSFFEVQCSPLFTPKIIGQNLKKIYAVSNIIDTFQTSKKEVLYEILACYSSGLILEFKGFLEESLLTRFRIFESIAFHYFNGIKKNELHFDLRKDDAKLKVKALLNEYIGIQYKESDYNELSSQLINNAVKKIHTQAYSKIVYMLKMYNVSFVPSEVNKMVSMRNDMTHMNGGKYCEDELIKYTGIIDKLCIGLIDKYFFGKDYSLDIYRD